MSKKGLCRGLEHIQLFPTLRLQIRQDVKMSRCHDALPHISHSGNADAGASTTFVLRNFNVRVQKLRCSYVHSKTWGIAFRKKLSREHSNCERWCRTIRRGQPRFQGEGKLGGDTIEHKICRHPNPLLHGTLGPLVRSDRRKAFQLEERCVALETTLSPSTITLYVERLFRNLPWTK